MKKHVLKAISVVFLMLFAITSVVAPLPHTVAAETSSTNIETLKDIQFMNSIDPNTVQHINNATLSPFLFNKLKIIEPMIIDKLKAESDGVIDDFRIDDLSWNPINGRVELKCYYHVSFIKLFRTHGDLILSCFMLTNSDFSNIGVGNFTVNYLDSNTLDCIRTRIQKEFNKNLRGKTFWLEEKVKSASKFSSILDLIRELRSKSQLQYQVLTSGMLPAVATKMLNKYFNKSITTNLPYEIGTVDVKFANFNCSQLDLTNGVASISTDINIAVKDASDKIETYDIAKLNLLNIEFYVDTVDNKLVIKLTNLEPKITHFGGLLDDIICKILKQKLIERGEYVKILAS